MIVGDRDHSKSDKHRNVITFMRSPLAIAYQVLLTSITAFVRYLADKRTHRYTDINTHTHTHTADHNACSASINQSINQEFLKWPK